MDSSSSRAGLPTDADGSTAASPGSPVPASPAASPSPGPAIRRTPLRVVAPGAGAAEDVAAARRELPDYIHCAYCGEIIRIEAKVCRFCREVLDPELLEAQLQQHYHWQTAAGMGYREPLPKAQASMIVGITSLVMSLLLGIGIIPAIIAIWLGISAQKLNRKHPMRYEGAGGATTGIACGAVGAFISITMLIVLASLA